MTHWRKIWTEELNNWLIEHKELNRKECYELFIKTFSNTDVTFTAFANQRSRLKAIQTKYAISKMHKGGRKPCEIGAIHFKKGYMKVKISQPNVWKFKHHIVWDATHPDNPVNPIKEQVLFLDGNNRNFDPDNLYKVNRAIMGILNQKGGMKKNDPKKTLLNLTYAKLYHQIHIRAKELGLTTSTGQLKTNVNQRRKEYLEKIKQDPEKYSLFLEKAKQRYRVRMDKLKQDPKEYEKHKAKVRAMYRKRMDKLKQDPERYKAYLKKVHETEKKYRMNKKKRQ